MQGQRLGPFLLQKMLGQGGQSVVWLCSDARTGRSCALKVLRPGFAGPVEVARLRREATLLNTFSDAGLPRGFEFFEDGHGTFALAMEFVDGRSLADLVETIRFSPAQVIILMRELSRIVSVLHARGIAHRDIKPGNIVVKDGWDRGVPGAVVLVDLGIARGTQQHATAHTATGFTMGTFRYMPPEALFGIVREDLAAQGDVFALGVLMWILLTGQHPTGLPTGATFPQIMSVYMQGWHFSVNPQQFSGIESAVPGLVSVIAQCLKTDASSRFSDGGQLLAALARVASKITSHPASSPSPLVHTTSSPKENASGSGVSPPRDRSSLLPAFLLVITLVFGSAVVALGLVLNFYIDTSQERGPSSSQSRVAPARTCSSSCERGQLCAQGRCMTLDAIQGTSFAPCRVDLPTDLPSYDAFAALRQGPSTTSVELARLQDLTSLKILSLDETNWARVSTDGQPTGYIHRDILACDAWIGSPPPGGRPPGVLRLPGKK